jgi:hypothetical protein
VASCAGAGLVPACGPHYSADHALRGAAACASADSFLANAFPRPLSMRGRATFDVDSYRVRGRFDLQLAANGDAVLEFAGSTLLGGHREDAVISLSSDTLRVLDRERGHYYEGDDVTGLVESGTHDELQAIEDGTLGAGYGEPGSSPFEHHGRRQRRSSGRADTFRDLSVQSQSRKSKLKGNFRKSLTVLLS